MDELILNGPGAAGMGEGDGFFRVAAATPELRVGDVRGNAEAILACVRRAAHEGVRALVLPELCLAGYTCADLFHDRALLRSCEAALAWLLDQTRALPVFFTVGMPYAQGESVYNCAACCCAGELLGMSVKSHLPNYREFYEGRWFAPAPENPSCATCAIAGRTVPFGARIVYRCVDEGCSDLAIGVEICEDLWVPDSPSTHMALEGGATVLLNLSASDEVIGKSTYRRDLVRGQSARLYAAYAYANAGEGESTTDLVFAGENLIAENGALLARTELFTRDMAVADVDLDMLMAERRRSNTWVRPASPTRPCHDTAFSFKGALSVPGNAVEAGSAPAPDAAILLSAAHAARVAPRTPFVPAGEHERSERCETIFNLQAAGLKTRLAHTHTEHAVIGLSGGLDSTLALLVTVRAFDALGLPRTGVHAVSMPGFGTTARTKTNAERLAEHLGVDFRTISIAEAVRGHFSDIGHDPAVTDVTYENAQARERTQVLMDLSNELGGFVIGTGDLSELALGWATYNADHMSMYGVNAGVPKTLVRYLVAHAADVFGGEAAATLRDILDTPVSPELLPPTGDGQIAQCTEELVGPYELHDFFLFHMLRHGFAPGKIYRMACRTFAEAAGEGAPAYEPQVILSWLRTFYRRFFAQQFKRSCLPDGPKVGSVSVSPRGDWRMPSDASAALWLEEIDSL
ncbi:MAG: NAD(+) synthase [Coriobacteriaceae bacterium]|nr:NAD(+) synthase [Coriobacteriaceae bacterium]